MLFGVKNIYVIWCRNIMLFGVEIYLLCGVEIFCYVLIYILVAYICLFNYYSWDRVELYDLFNYVICWYFIEWLYFIIY